ncbi:MAG: hypothetical protein JPMHGGIA_00402 [Saprospiraceae bacterium]|nr:hypothetical protein [Saprospiraceae bacterium]
MLSLKGELVRPKYFLAAYWVSLCILTALCFVFSKSDIHLTSNQWIGNPPVDQFFKMITLAGDGTVAFVLVAVLAVWRPRFAIWLLASIVLSTLLLWLFKYGFFSSNLRPCAWFSKECTSLKLVPGVKVHSLNSFPSGHATTVFGYCSLLVVMFTGNGIRLALLLFAWLVAYSRVHLSLHFLEDILAGSFLGVLSTLLCVHFLKIKDFRSPFQRFTNHSGN